MQQNCSSSFFAFSSGSRSPMLDFTSALYLGPRVLPPPAGLATLLLAGQAQPGVPEIAFCLRADHSAADIGRATATLAALARRSDRVTASPSISAPS